MASVLLFFTITIEFDFTYLDILKANIISSICLAVGFFVVTVVRSFGVIYLLSFS